MSAVDLLNRDTAARVSFNLYWKGIDEPSESGQGEMDGQAREGNGRAERERTSQILERVAIGSDNQWHIYFPQQNHEGSVTLLTDTSGTVIERYRYDTFGAPTIYDANWNTRSATIYDNRFLFTGREYAATYRSTYNTPSFNFYEYRARAYNPQLGRFMSEDPKLFDAGDYNLFRYCHNDPVDFSDPLGLEDHREPWPNHQEQAKALEDNSYNFIMGLMQREFSSAISAGMAGYGQWSAWSTLQNGLAALSKAVNAIDPTHIRMIRSFNARNGTMLGEMWHTDDRGNMIGGVDAFLANTGINTAADNPSKGFYSTGGPLPPGNYMIRPKQAWQVEKGDSYPAGWPAITSRGLASGHIYAPGGQQRSALFIHGYGTSNGCLAFPDYALRNVFAAMKAGPVYVNLRKKLCHNTNEH